MSSCHLRKAASLIIIATLVVAAPAHADPTDDYINPDRPGIADGSTTVGFGHFQIETAIQREYRRNGDEREHTTFIPTLLRYGFSKSWEFVSKATRSPGSASAIGLWAIRTAVVSPRPQLV